MWAERLKKKTQTILNAAGFTTMVLPSGKLGIVGASARTIHTVTGFEILLDEADGLIQEMWQWLPILELAYQGNPSAPVFADIDAGNYLAEIRKRLLSYQAPIKAILEERPQHKRPRE